jgi:hypothetical protein
MFILSFVSSNSPVNVAAVASILDVTPASEKSRVLGRRGACFILGSFIGLAGSYYLSDTWASIACMICTALSVLMHLFLWPETLPVTDRVPFQLGNLNPFKPLVFFFQSPAYRYLFFVMLVEQLVRYDNIFTTTSQQPPPLLPFSLFTTATFLRIVFRLEVVSTP